jgi:hypothetical protein
MFPETVKILSSISQGVSQFWMIKSIKGEGKIQQDDNNVHDMIVKLEEDDDSEMNDDYKYDPLSFDDGQEEQVGIIGMRNK